MSLIFRRKSVKKTRTNKGVNIMVSGKAATRYGGKKRIKGKIPTAAEISAALRVVA